MSATTLGDARERPPTILIVDDERGIRAGLTTANAVRAGLGRGDVVRLPAQALGQALRHSVPPDQPIPLADLGRPAVVNKGAAMTLTLESPGLQLTAQGVATEPGGIGEHIRVLNPL